MSYNVQFVQSHRRSLIWFFLLAYIVQVHLFNLIYYIHSCIGTRRVLGLTLIIRSLIPFNSTLRVNVFDGAATRCLHQQFLGAYLSILCAFIFPVSCLFAPRAQKGIDTDKKSTRFWKQCRVDWNYTWSPNRLKIRKWLCVHARTSSKSF